MVYGRMIMLNILIFYRMKLLSLLHLHKWFYFCWWRQQSLLLRIIVVGQ